MDLLAYILYVLSHLHTVVPALILYGLGNREYKSIYAYLRLRIKGKWRLLEHLYVNSPLAPYFVQLYRAGQSIVATSFLTINHILFCPIKAAASVYAETLSAPDVWRAPRSAVWIGVHIYGP